METEMKTETEMEMETETETKIETRAEYKANLVNNKKCLLNIGTPTGTWKTSTKA